jgi:hypothetical protein
VSCSARVDNSDDSVLDGIATGVVVGAVVAARSIVSIINVLVGICISR